MTTWACVLRSGGDYRPEHVARLANGIRRYQPDAHIVCLSDVALPRSVKRIPLARNWPGWWSKMELWTPGLLDSGDLIVYLDLDTVIVGDPTILESYTGDLAVLRDFYRESMIGSGVMLWRGAPMRECWDDFTRDPEAVLASHPWRSDYHSVEWLQRGDRVQDVFPGVVASYKAHVRPKGKIPDGCSLVCFHGSPSPDAVPSTDPAYAFVERSP